MEKGIAPERLYKLEDICEILGLKVRTLREALSSGQMKGFKKHRRYFVLGKDVIEYLQK